MDVGLSWFSRRKRVYLRGSSAAQSMAISDLDKELPKKKVTGSRIPRQGDGWNPRMGKIPENQETAVDRIPGISQ